MLKKAVLNANTYKIAYVFLLAILVLYTKSVLKNVTVDVDTKAKKGISFEIKPITVNFISKTSAGSSQYTLKMKNNDSFDDLLETMRQNHGLTYEKTEYIYGTQITKVNGFDKNDYFFWSVWEKTREGNMTKLTDINNGVLRNDSTYLLLYSQKGIDHTPTF
jgi:hypothetical protein